MERRVREKWFYSILSSPFYLLEWSFTRKTGEGFGGEIYGVFEPFRAVDDNWFVSLSNSKSNRRWKTSSMHKNYNSAHFIWPEIAFAESRKNSSRESVCSAMLRLIAMVLEIFSDRSRRAFFFSSSCLFLFRAESGRKGWLCWCHRKRNEIPTRSLKHICVIFCVFFSLHLWIDFSREGNHKRVSFGKSPVSLLPESKLPAFEWRVCCCFDSTLECDFAGAGSSSFIRWTWVMLEVSS